MEVSLPARASLNPPGIIIMRPSILLSHNHADKAFVRLLAADLDNQGIPYWLDEAEIKVGESLISGNRPLI